MKTKEFREKKCKKFRRWPCKFLIFSRGTKVEKMLTVAPKRYTAEFCMVKKVVLKCI